MGYENSGRRPQPTELKVLRGNPGRERLNENEPVPPYGEVVKPDGMTPGGGAMWDELAPICLAMRTLTAADVRAFASLCELQSTMVQTSAHKGEAQLFSLREEDPDEPAQLVVKIDAVLKLERETANALRPYYELFGLTPVARARISVPKAGAEEPASKWAGALK